MSIITRFAPSPTGRLHLGHAYSALFSYILARDAGGRFILRIEDIDPERCRPEFEQGIFDDLAWLGLDWQKPVRRQSDYLEFFREALRGLADRELLYPCFCSRKEISEEIDRAGVAPHGPEGHLYPGTCRNLSENERLDRIASGAPYCFRLDMGKAIAMAGGPLYWHDRAAGKQRATPEIVGDVVLARKDISASYHLCVTHDDHIQGVTLVTRGQDLFYATHLHRLLQELGGLDVPEYHHHKLLLDEQGKRFAKRDQSKTLLYMREHEGLTANDIMDMTGLHL